MPTARCCQGFFHELFATQAFGRPVSSLSPLHCHHHDTRREMYLVKGIPTKELQYQGKILGNPNATRNPCNLTTDWPHHRTRQALLCADTFDLPCHQGDGVKLNRASQLHSKLEDHVPSSHARSNLALVEWGWARISFGNSRKQCLSDRTVTTIHAM